MRRNKHFKIIILIIILFIIALIIYGTYSYKNYRDGFRKIELASGRFYPEENNGVKEYTLYTDKEEVTINCTGINDSDICGKTINVKDGLNNYEITSKSEGKDEKYKVKIVRQENDESKIIKISKIDGILTNWQKETTITINIEKNSNIDGVEYSFDGGKTWSKSNTKIIKENQVLKILAKDYFGFKNKRRNCCN